MKKLFTFVTVMLLSLFGSVTVNAETIPLWEGSTASGDWTWDGRVQVDQTGFASAQVGDILRISFTQDAEKFTYFQLKTQYITAEWGQDLLTSNAAELNEWGCITLAAGATSYDITLNETDVANLKNYHGFIATGYGLVFTKLELITPIEYETTGSALAFDEYGQIFTSAFLGYTENAKVVFTATVTGAEGYVGWGNGSIQSLDGKVTVANLTIKGEGDNKYSFTLKDLKEALLSGPNQYGNFGVVFNQWAVGDGACTCVRKSVEIFEVAGVVGEEVTATVNDGESIGDAIAAVSPLGTKIGKLTINLQEGATVKLNSTLKISDDLTINGNGAIIDAWNVGANPLILLTGGRTATAAAAAPHRAPETMVSGYYYIDNVILKNLTIWNVRGSIVYDNKMKVAVENLTIDNCQLPLKTEKVNYESLIAFEQGGVKDFTIQNSTVYNYTDTGAKYFFRETNNGRMDRLGYDKSTQTQSWTYINNTFYKTINNDNGQWGNGPNGQNYFKYTIKNNIWVDCSKDVIRRLGHGRIATKDELLDFGHNTYFCNGEDLSASEASYDKSGTILTTNPAFADADKDNFTIGASTQQAKYQTGDPRWLTAFAATDEVDVFVADGAEISALVLAEAPTAKAVNIYLTPGSSYTLNSPIETFVKFIGVESGEQAVIDASALTNAMIMLPKQAGVDADEKGFFALGDVTIQGVRITGVPKQVFWANQTKYLVPTLTVDNSVIALAASNSNVFDTSRGGVIGNFVIKNSTIACPDGKNTGSLFSSQSGQKATEAGLEKQVFSFQNSTFYNIANGKNLITHRQSGQTWLNYELKNCIAVNSGKSGQFVVGMNQGQASANPVWAISGNSFNFEGEEGLADTSAAEVTKAGQKEVEKEDGTKEKVDIVTDNVEGVVKFVNPVEADFTLAYCPQLLAKIGDPRWVDSDLAAVADELAKEVEAAIALLGDTDPASSTEATNLNKAIASAQAMLESATTNTQFYKEELAKLKEAEEAFKATIVDDKSIFSATPTEAWDAPAGAETEIPAANATITGGKMYANNGQDAAKAMIKVQGGEAAFQCTNNNTFFKVVLDKALEAGDVISTRMQTRTDTDLGLFFAAEATRPSETTTAIIVPTADGQVWTDAPTYTVAAGDGICGQTTFYIFRATGKSTYFNAFKITRDGTTGISNVQTIQIDNEAVYNLSGQKVDASYKGVVIKGGKKFFQK